jgi:hypothetical protein
MVEDSDWFEGARDDLERVASVSAAVPALPVRPVGPFAPLFEGLDFSQSFIDWVDFFVPLASAFQLPAPMTCGYDESGALEWSICKRVPVRGSYDARIFVRPVDFVSEAVLSRRSLEAARLSPLLQRCRSAEVAACDLISGPGLRISGCPGKFLQGHNLHVRGSLPELVQELVVKVCAFFGLCLQPLEFQRLLVGAVRLYRVDLTAMFSAGSRRAACEVVSHVGRYGFVPRQRRGGFVGETTAQVVNSHGVKLKLYAKGPELEARGKGHALPLSLPHRQRLLSLADDAVRVELRLDSRGLKDRGLQFGTVWDAATPRSVLEAYMSKVDVPGHVRAEPEWLSLLSSAFRKTYFLWLGGAEVRSLVSDATYYRHRKVFLLHGIDISVRRDVKPSGVYRIEHAVRLVPVKFGGGA